MGEITNPVEETPSEVMVGDQEAEVVDFSDDSKEEVFVASQWKLMWWRFRKHRLAVISIFVVVLFYLVALFSEFVAPYDPFEFNARYKFVPPQTVHIFDENGNLSRPFVYELDMERDPETLREYYEENQEVKYYLQFFAEGIPYKLWGTIDSNVHLVGLGPDAGRKATLYLMGTDRMGRDMFSRIVYGARVSLSIGLIGVILNFVLGIIIGGISGYYGGTIDMLIQRTIEFLRSIPTIPLWMGLAAALPVDWPPLQRYFLITVILSLIGWTGMARVVRGRFLALREEDFVLAARLSGASELRIILRHMVPSFTSHIIASLTLSIPGMILSETSLSFLGLGLRPPVISWGVLLQEAQNVRTVALAPWLLLPGLMIVITILAFNFLGDGLRDAADPYVR